MEQQHYLDPTGEKKLPGSINVLTILTFIGSGLGLIGSIWSFARAQKSYEDMQKLMNSDDLEKMPAFVRKMYTPEMLDFMRKSYENRFPVMILSVIGCVLCIYGAMEMRKLKQTGYWLWLAGELMPFVAIIFTGIVMGWNFYIMITIIALFIILYSTQRKYLVNK